MINIFKLLCLYMGLSEISGWTLTMNPAEDRLQNRRTGENFLAVCKIKEFDGGASDAKIEWYRDDKAVPHSGSTMTIERIFSSQLMINRPKITDNGKYTCKAVIGSETQEVSAVISFVDPPTFLNIKRDQHPEEGSRAEIVCEVEGTDQLEVFWQFNGVTLDEPSQRGYEFSENKQILYIPYFTAKVDDGIYNCNAAQYSSFETLSVNVTGYARPIITVFDLPNGNRGIEGHTIELKCGAIGKPKPTYEWFYENDEVPLARSDKHNVDEGLLIIDSLNSEDAGNYKCIAKNAVGQTEKSFDLTVFLKPEVDLKHEHAVKKGEDIELVCRYHGEGRIAAKFFSGSREYRVEEASENVVGLESSDLKETSKNDNFTPEEKSVEENSEMMPAKHSSNVSAEDSHNDYNSHYQKRDEQDKTMKKKRFNEFAKSPRTSLRVEENKLILKIENIRLEDAADYTCSVTNEAGTTNKISQVGVIHSPTLRHYTGPYVRSYYGNTVSIYCEVSAVPSPIWHWYKNGNEVEANGVSIKIDTQTTVTKLTLENSETDDNFGVYTCRAKNEVGLFEKNINVIKVVTPTTPNEVDCKKIIYPNFGKCSFDLSIYTNEESKPQTMDFLIANFSEMESDYNWDHAQKVFVPFGKDLTVPNLTPNTQYVVKVRATNEAGSSEYSNEISFETTDPWAPETPSHVKMSCSDYCTLFWIAPNNHGSPISKYRVTIQEMKLEGSGVNMESEFTSSTAETGRNHLTGEIKIQGKQKMDSEEKFDSSKKPETEKKEDTDENEVSLENDFAEVLPTDASDHVERDDSELISHGSLTILEVDANESQLRITNIKPHSYYKISVIAENAIGQGEPAEIEYQTNENPTEYNAGINSTYVAIGTCIGVAFILLLVDLGCYITNRCGFIACVCLNLCGKHSAAKQRDVETGRGGPENNRLLDSNTTR